MEATPPNNNGNHMRPNLKEATRQAHAVAMKAIRARFEEWAAREYADALEADGSAVLGAREGKPWNKLKLGEYRSQALKAAWNIWLASATPEGSPNIYVGESVNTGYLDRFVDALELLCTARPDRDLCEEWLRHAPGSERLQDWAVDHTRANWGTGIGTIEAAEVMAENPEEGAGHEGFRQDFVPAREDSETESCEPEPVMALVGYFRKNGKHWDKLRGYPNPETLQTGWQPFYTPQAAETECSDALEVR
jgi:hypothetical protein